MIVRDYVTEIHDFADQVRAAPDKDAAWSVLMNKLQEMGFIHAKYGFVSAPASSMTPPDMLNLGTLCEDYEKAFPGSPDPNKDAVIEYCMAHDNPLTYDTLYKLMDAGSLKPGQKQTHSLAREMEMRNGVAFSLPDATPLSMGGISLEGSRDESPEEFQKRLSDMYPMLRLLMEVFHANLQRPLLIDRKRTPSPREAECLLWISQGLRPKQIAHKLGIHAKTVDKRLHSVRQKLNAKTNAQAVTRAVVLGLIKF